MSYINISNEQPNYFINNMLLLGLKYIPVPTNSTHLDDIIRLNLEKFHRSLRLRAFFKDTQQKDKLTNGKKYYYIPNPSWNPPQSDASIIVEKFIEENVQTFEQILHHISNITRDELLQFAKNHNPDHEKINKVEDLIVLQTIVMLIGKIG
jgi:hypothetical protein